METAKVDIRKLQLLNDRINQCIDALSQVRMSVHGLSHTSTAAGSPLGASGFAPTGIDPRLAGGFNPVLSASPLFSGISHTTAPYALSSPVVGPYGFLQTPGVPVGLSHTSAEADVYARPTWADPYLAARVSQTFPYVNFALPPVVTIY